MRQFVLAIGLIACLPATGTAQDQERDSAATAAGAKPGAPFHVDGIIPGEGAESDCFTAFQRPGDQPLPGQRDIPDVFQEVSNYAFIKIDGKVHTLKLTGTSNLGKPSTYRDSTTTVVETGRVTKVDKDKEGDTYYLKGKLVVTYRGQSQTISVRGTSFCYSGSDDGV